MRDRPAFIIETLGCKVNQYDAQQIRRALELAGMRPAAAGEKAGFAVAYSWATKITATHS